MKKQFICMLVLGCVFAGLFSVFGQMQDWSMHNGCRERTSWAADEDMLKPPLQEINVLKVGGLIENADYQNMTWYDHTLCVSIFDSSENLFAMFDTNTGDTLWTFRVPSSIGSSNFSPAQNDTLVLCGGYLGTGLFALDRLTGEQKWFQPKSNLYSRSPILDGEHIYISAGAINCLRVSDGTVKWSWPGYSSVTPAVDDANCFACGSYTMNCYNKMNAFKQWTRYNSRFSYVGPVLMGDYMYTFTSDSVVAYEKATGKIHWVYQAVDCGIALLDQNAIAVSDSVLCCSIYSNPDGKGRLLALNRTDGTYLWHHDFNYPGVHAPTIANGFVYTIQPALTELFVFKLSTGELIFQDGTHYYRRQPIVADHKLYVSTWRDGVIVFENVPTGIAEKGDMKPDLFDLHPNFPNPFNPVTTIHYTLHSKSHVELTVFNISGQIIYQLENGQKEAGSHSVVWSGKDQKNQPMTSGIYLCRLKTSESAKTIRMVMLK